MNPLAALAVGLLVAASGSTVWLVHAWRRWRAEGRARMRERAEDERAEQRRLELARMVADLDARQADVRSRAATRSVVTDSARSGPTPRGLVPYDRTGATDAVAMAEHAAAAREIADLAALTYAPEVWEA